jgi:hypothetical protein
MLESSTIVMLAVGAGILFLHSEFLIRRDDLETPPIHIDLKCGLSLYSGPELGSEQHEALLCLGSLFGRFRFLC